VHRPIAAPAPAATAPTVTADDGAAAAVVEVRNRHVSRRQHVVHGAVRRVFRRPQHPAERADAPRTVTDARHLHRRRPAAASVVGPERLRVPHRQRHMRRTPTPHAHSGPQPRRPLRATPGHPPVLSADGARSARIPSRVHGRLAVVGRPRRRPPGPAAPGVVPARRRGAGKLPGSVQEPDVQARDGPDVVRETVPAVRLHGQDGRRHRGERVQAERSAGTGRQPRSGRVRDRRETHTGQEQQVVREPRRVCGRRVPAVPVRLAIRGQGGVRPASAAGDRRERKILLDRRSVRDGHTRRTRRTRVHRPETRLRDRPGTDTLLRTQATAVRLSGSTHRRRRHIAPAVRKTAYDL